MFVVKYFRTANRPAETQNTPLRSEGKSQPEESNHGENTLTPIVLQTSEENCLPEEINPTERLCQAGKGQTKALDQIQGLSQTEDKNRKKASGQQEGMVQASKIETAEHNYGLVWYGQAEGLSQANGIGKADGGNHLELKNFIAFHNQKF